MSEFKRTPLLKAALAVSIAGTVVLLLLISYVGLAVYYAAHVRPPDSGSSSVEIVGNDTIRVVELVNLTDPGPFPIDDLTVVAQIGLSNSSSTTSWITTASPVQSIPGYGVAPIALSLLLPLRGSGGVSALLTNSSSLPLHIWVNASYAMLAVVGIEANTTYHWGAPFAQLSVEPGTPNVQLNGTLAESIGLSFVDQASFADDGSLGLALQSSSGSACGELSVPVSDAPGQEFTASPTLYVPSSCPLAGGSYLPSWTGGGLSVSLPGGPIP